jgi:orotate phosphoribosyltransferase
VLIALDRQERGKGELSAIQEVERDFGTRVISIVSLADVVAYLTEKGGHDAQISAINTYRESYGI